MWKSFENIGLQTSEKVSWEKKKHAQNIRSTVHRTGDLIKIVTKLSLSVYSETEDDDDGGKILVEPTQSIRGSQEWTESFVYDQASIQF